MTTKISLLTAAIFLIFSQGTAGQELRWKFSPSDTFSVKLTQNSKIESEVNSRKIETTQDVSVWMDWTVDSIEDDLAKMTWRFNRVASKSSTTEAVDRSKGESSVPDVVEFDSDSDEPELLAAKKLWKGVRPILGQPFEVTMSSRGEIVSVNIPEETMKVLRTFSGSMRVRRIMTDDGIREVLGQTSCVFPEEQLSPGHVWSQSRIFEIPLGKIKQVISYNYQGATDDQTDLHLVEVKAEASVDSFVSDGRPKLEIKSQDSGGQLWFDPETGIMNSAEVKSSMETVTPYRDMEIVAQMETTLKMSVEKK